MNNQKDKQKTGLNIYKQSNETGIKTLVNKPVYDFVNKKTEKLVTALYMVTDCMETDDAIKGKLRLLGVELLSDTYKLPSLSPVDKHIHISISLSRIFEVLSFIEIAHNIGFISEMNAGILKREFQILASELQSYQSKDKHFTFALDKNMFNIERNNLDNSQMNMKQNIKDKKITFNNNMSFRNDNMSSLSLIKKTSSNDLIKEKQDRYDRIIFLIKDLSMQADKNNLNDGGKGVSIKDISGQFLDCSEKTIQRELNHLISKGQIKKIGSKRWSRYHL